MTDELKAWAEDRAYDSGYEQGREDAMQTSVSILMGLDTQIAYLFENIVKNAEHYNKRDKNEKH